MQTLSYLYRSVGSAVAACLVLTSAHGQDVKPGDINAARSKIAMCIGCHGIPGYQASFPEVYKVPKISGQSEAYLKSALTAYRKGDRKHPTMKAVAEPLTDQDIADLAAYYAQHSKTQMPTTAAPPKPTPQVQAMLDKGACVTCHGAQLNQPLDGTYPKLAGQHADYLYAALKSYRAQPSQSIGRANPIMAAPVLPFSNQELKQLADYIASMPGDLETVSQSRFK